MKRTKTTTFINELAGRLSNYQTAQFFVFTIFLAMCTINLKAQDLIIKKDGTEIEAKVQEIKSSTIKYKRFEMQDGPSYEIDKREVFMIKYPSGQKDVFSQENTAQKNKVRFNIPLRNNEASKKNAIGVNPIMLFFDLDSKVAYADYERLIGDRFSVGGRIVLSEKTDYRYYHEAKGIGVFVKRYFNGGKGLKGFYIGSSIDFLGVDWNSSWRRYNISTYEYETFYDSGSGMVISVTSQLGWKLGIGKSFFVEPSGIVGFYTGNDDFGIVAAPALTFGFKF